MVRRAREIVRDGAIAMSDDRGVSHIHDLALAPSGEPGINNGHREGSLLRRLHPSSQQSLDFALEPFVYIDEVAPWRLAIPLQSWSNPLA